MDLGKYLEFFMGGKVPTKHFGLLVEGTYILGIAFAILMVVISVFIAKSIYTLPDKSDVGKRKKWFWALSFIAPVLFTIYNYFLILDNISKIKQVNFTKTIGFSFLAMLISYILLGVVISFIFRKGKLGDWFFANKNKLK